MVNDLDMQTKRRLSDWILVRGDNIRLCSYSFHGSFPHPEIPGLYASDHKAVSAKFILKNFDKEQLDEDKKE